MKFLRIPRKLIALLSLMILVAPPLELRAQEACHPPQPPVLDPASDIFNEQQEMDLGDAIAAQTERRYRVSSDPRFINFLNQIGERLLKQMPPTNLRIRFSFVDISDVNAFDAPGGRIYISVKLIAAAQSEDELAGVVAHEMGHMIVHQGAIDTTRLFREVLNVKQVTDRRDIFNKYHQLVESAWRKPYSARITSDDIDKAQDLADQWALFATGSAGYTPEALPNFFDRTAGLKGKKGNWLTDLFGATPPNSARLRDMIKGAAAIPPSCVNRAPRASESDFKKWQADVIAGLNWNSTELLHGVVHKVTLHPPLRDEIRYVKFSPDGKYLLAQDDGNIYVLSREPFKALFQIPAQDAEPAQFSPDSKSVVFSTSHLRMEAWSIENRSRTSVHELVAPKGCWKSGLSPDGKVFACLEDFSGSILMGFNPPDVVLFDVASGNEILRKPKFYNVPTGYGLTLEERLNSLMAFSHAEEFLGMQFSPDGRYFLITANGPALIYDLEEHQALSTTGELRKHLSGNFSFLGSDRLVVVNVDNHADSHILEFPSGKILGDVSVGVAKVSGATRGNYVILRPVSTYAVGVVDAATGKGVLAYRLPALDIYDDMCVVEKRDGEIELVRTKTMQELGLATLPQGELGTLKAVDVSTDWKWLAASEKSRGAVWNLDSGAPGNVLRGFGGAFVTDDGHLYGDFPKYGDQQHGIFNLALSAGQFSLSVDLKDDDAAQYGPYLVAYRRPGDKSKKDQDSPPKFSFTRSTEAFGKGSIEVRSVSTGKILWTRDFSHEVPALSVDTQHGFLLLAWDAQSTQAKDEMKAFPATNDDSLSRKEKQSSFLVEVVEGQTGKPVGIIAANAGSSQFSINGAKATRDWAALRGAGNRVEVYSLSTGKETASFFGNHFVLSDFSALLCVENEPGHLILYDVRSGEDLDRWVFSSAVELMQFSADGKRLLVLTADQSAYTLDVSETELPADAANTSPPQP